jgi:multiple antibiotic resistance protein
MDSAFALTAFVTLFVTIDPIGLTPVFISLTRGMPTGLRRAISLRACLAAIVLLTLFGLLGENLLRFIGISMPAFRIAGGVLLFLTAIDMLFERRTQRREGQSDGADDHADPSIFPLAMPLIAGPGAMVLGVMAAVVAITFALFQAAGLLERALGRTGVLVITRLLGMLLAALSVQFVIDGIRGAGLL